MFPVMIGVDASASEGEELLRNHDQEVDSERLAVAAQIEALSDDGQTNPVCV